MSINLGYRTRSNAGTYLIHCSYASVSSGGGTYFALSTSSSSVDSQGYEIYTTITPFPQMRTIVIPSAGAGSTSINLIARFSTISGTIKTGSRMIVTRIA